MFFGRVYKLSAMVVDECILHNVSVKVLFQTVVRVHCSQLYSQRSFVRPSECLRVEESPERFCGNEQISDTMGACVDVHREDEEK